MTDTPPPQQQPIAPKRGMVTLAEQIQCIELELVTRRHAYPVMVAKKKIEQQRAEIELARMAAVLATLRVLAEGRHPAADTAPKGATLPPTRQGGKPLILYFADDKIRADFMKLVGDSTGDANVPTMQVPED